MIAVLIFTMLLSCSIPKNIPLNIVIEDYKVNDSINYKINKVEIINYSLVLEIEYLGSKNDEFNLLFSGKYKKSYPPIVNLYLDHKQIKSVKSKKLSKILTYKLDRIEYPNTESTIIYLYYYDDNLIYKHKK
ncbi:hypothetical protein ACFLTE_03515 [Bacteroidota bacterium]